jgi:hypothetical protein
VKPLRRQRQHRGRERVHDRLREQRQHPGLERTRRERGLRDERRDARLEGGRGLHRRGPELLATELVTPELPTGLVPADFPAVLVVPDLPAHLVAMDAPPAPSTERVDERLLLVRLPPRVRRVLVGGVGLRLPVLGLSVVRRVPRRRRHVPGRVHRRPTDRNVQTFAGSEVAPGTDAGHHHRRLHGIGRDELVERDTEPLRDDRGAVPELHVIDH